MGSEASAGTGVDCPARDPSDSGVRGSRGNQRGLHGTGSQRQCNYRLPWSPRPEEWRWSSLCWTVRLERRAELTPVERQKGRQDGRQDGTHTGRLKHRVDPKEGKTGEKTECRTGGRNRNQGIKQ